MEAMQMLKFYLHEENLNNILREPIRNTTEAECSLELPTDIQPVEEPQVVEAEGEEEESERAGYAAC